MKNDSAPSAFASTTGPWLVAVSEPSLLMVNTCSWSNHSETTIQVPVDRITPSYRNGELLSGVTAPRVTPEADRAVVRTPGPGSEAPPEAPKYRAPAPVL